MIGIHYLSNDFFIYCLSFTIYVPCFSLRLDDFVFIRMYTMYKKRKIFSNSNNNKKNKKSMWCFMHEDDVLFSHKISKRYRKGRREGFIFIRHIFPFWFGMVSPNIYLLMLCVRVKVIHGNEKKKEMWYIFFSLHNMINCQNMCGVTW